jgi:hypothetical protein
MKTWKLTIALLVVALVATGAFNAFAAGKGVNVTVTGECVNMLKAVGGDNAPEADGTFGALNILKVTEITDADGQAVEDVPVVHLLPTASASSLLSGDAKTVTVKGVLFKDCLTLQVDEVVGDAAGDDDGFDDWDEIGITTMSQQAII